MEGATRQGQREGWPILGGPCELHFYETKSYRMFLQADYPNLFPDYQASLQAQQMLARERANVIPASDFKEILVIVILKPSSR